MEELARLGHNVGHHGRSRIQPDCPGCRALLKIVEQLQAQVKQLEQRLEKVEREGKRQAAPFRKKLKANPKKPSRKSGPDHGQHHRRQPPERIDESYDVPLPTCCPNCSCDRLTKTDTRTQYQTDIPRTVIHRQFNIDVGTCTGCGKAVQGRHELQTSGASGAAGVQLGPNLHAAMALCNKELGLSHGKVKRPLGMDWSGIFGHDGWSVYDKFTAATHQQCLAHLLRRCEPLIDSGTGGALAFPRAVKRLLLKGLEYRERYRAKKISDQ